MDCRKHGIAPDIEVRQMLHLYRKVDPQRTSGKRGTENGRAKRRNQN
jgi:hypothetical protein